MGIVNPMGGNVQIAILNAERIMVRMADALEGIERALAQVGERLVEVEATVTSKPHECAPSAPPKGRTPS